MVYFVRFMHKNLYFMFTIINRYLNFMNGGILMKFKEWDGFVNGDWQSEIDVRDFIQKIIRLILVMILFLVKLQIQQKTLGRSFSFIKKKLKMGGVLDISNDIASTITSHDAGYIDKNLEKIVGLQTDAPLKELLCLMAVFV